MNMNTNTNTSAWSTFNCPLGFRFRPTDKELVQYLRKKINKEPLPAGLIHDVDLYAFPPYHLYEKYGEPEEKYMYFFTPRNRRYANGNRPNRRAGEGHWKPGGRGVGFGTERHRLGKKTVLSYYVGRPPNLAKTNWIMHEFVIEDAPSTKRGHRDMKLDDWVLCKVYKKDFDKPRRNDEERSYVASEYPASDAEISTVLDVTNHDQYAPEDEVIINNLNSSMPSSAVGMTLILPSNQAVIPNNPNSSMPINIKGEGNSYGSSFGYDDNAQGQVLPSESGLRLESQNYSYNFDPAQMMMTVLHDNSNMAGEKADSPWLLMNNLNSSMPSSALGMTLTLPPNQTVITNNPNSSMPSNIKGEGNSKLEVPANPMQQLPGDDNFLLNDPFYYNLFGAPPVYDQQQQLNGAKFIIGLPPPLR